MSFLRLPSWCAQSHGKVIAALGEMGMCAYCMLRFLDNRSERFYSLPEHDLIEVMLPEEFCNPPADAPVADATSTAAASADPAADAVPAAAQAPVPVHEHLRGAKTALQTRGYCPLCYELLPVSERVCDLVAAAVADADYEFSDFFLARTVPAPLAIRQHGAWIALGRRFPGLAPFSDDAGMEKHVVELKEAAKLAHPPRIAAAVNRHRAARAARTVAVVAAERGCAAPPLPAALDALLTSETRAAAAAAAAAVLGVASLPADAPTVTLDALLATPETDERGAAVGGGDADADAPRSSAGTDAGRLHTRLVNLAPATLAAREGDFTINTLYLAAPVPAAAEAALTAEIERAQGAFSNGRRNGRGGRGGGHGGGRGGHGGGFGNENNHNRGSALSINTNLPKTIGKVSWTTLNAHGFAPPRLPTAPLAPGTQLTASGPQVPYLIQAAVPVPVRAATPAAAAAAAEAAAEAAARGVSVLAAHYAAVSGTEAVPMADDCADTAAAASTSASASASGGAECSESAERDGTEQPDAKRPCLASVVTNATAAGANASASASDAAVVPPRGSFVPTALAVLLARDRDRAEPRTGVNTGAVIQISPYLCVEVACFHRSLFVMGMYEKLSRVVSQSAWYVPLLPHELSAVTAATATTTASTAEANGDVALDPTGAAAAAAAGDAVVSGDGDADDKDKDDDDGDDGGGDDDDEDGGGGGAGVPGGIVARQSRGFQKKHATTADEDEGGPFAETSVESELAFHLLPHFWPGGVAGYRAAPRGAPGPAPPQLACDPRGVRARSEAACHPSAALVDATTLGFTRAATGALPALAAATDATAASLVAYSGYRFKFHSSGREDLNVRMLGSGRPFFLEFTDPHRAPRLTPALLARLTSVINANALAVALPAPLQAGDTAAFAAMTRGIGEKRKRYRCVVHCERAIATAAELTAAVDTEQELTITQETPLRVLLRRSALARVRTVSRLRTQWLSPHWFVLDLETQAGTYVKEFVHSDRGRTVPSVTAMLGAPCTIIQLDVTDLIM